LLDPPALGHALVVLRRPLVPATKRTFFDFFADRQTWQHRRCGRAEIVQVWNDADE
jgi:hypothetical protein